MNTINTTNTSIPIEAKDSSKKINANNNYLISDTFKYTLTLDPISAISPCMGAIIRHEIEYPIINTCYIRSKQYEIYYQSQDGLLLAFRCKLSNKCNCCSKNCTPIEILFRHATKDEIDPQISHIILKADKQCALNCCCCCRNEMSVYKFGEKENIGKIIEPCGLCDIKTDIYDEDNNLKFRIVGDFCCKLYRDIELTFEIQDERKNHVGSMTKMNFLSAVYSKSNVYKISFPEKATPNDKILIISASLFIEYIYFDI